MSGRRRSPQARDRILGAQLRTIRMERTDLSLEQAAEVSMISLSTLSRIENGKRHITSEDVALLLTIYRVPARQRALLVDAARAEVPSGWWQGRLPGLPPDIGVASHECTATALTSWSIAVLPELLQTRAYASAFLRMNGTEQREIDTLWETRARRRDQVFARADITAFVHELALHTPFGGRAALKEQLHHLLASVDRGIGVRLLRIGEPLGALVHPWLLWEFPRDPAVVHVGLQRSEVFLHEPEIGLYLAARTELARAACTVAETRTAIAAVIDRL
ncbi:Scr1 family TA system antitoxin-like transcriptional regulator [Actinokineospora sp. UTMC 2448]|nr:Scr1 family TA system antitoxin-like transcriptional regulator [Actinokineospora sp. UTMC 2448]